MYKIDREKQTVAKMIRLYCRRKEGNRTLCADCAELLEYASNKLDNCRFGADKSSCRLCRIHCYRSDMKARIRQVMRWAGPRMILYHPVAALRHLLSR